MFFSHGSGARWLDPTRRKNLCKESKNQSVSSCREKRAQRADRYPATLVGIVFGMAEEKTTTETAAIVTDYDRSRETGRA